MKQYVLRAKIGSKLDGLRLAPNLPRAVCIASAVPLLAIRPGTSFRDTASVGGNVALGSSNQD